MSNLVLLCHGAVSEFAKLELKKEQRVDYRGNFGSPLSEAVAKELVAALVDNFGVTDAQLRRSIPNYQGGASISGPTVTQDLELAGDDRLMCFVMDLNTRKYASLGKTFRRKLSTLLQPLGAKPFWLNLLCCTGLPGANVPSPKVDASLAQTSWEAVLRG